MTISLSQVSESTLNINTTSASTINISSAECLSPTLRKFPGSPTSSTIPSKRPFDATVSASASTTGSNNQEPNRDIVMADSITEGLNSGAQIHHNASLSSENFIQSPTNTRTSRVLSGSELTPLKLLGGSDIRSPSACSTGSAGSGSGDNNNFRTSVSSVSHPMSPSEKSVRSPRRVERRFPVRVSSPSAPTRPRTGSEATNHSVSPERPPMSIGEALRDNGNLAMAIQILENEEASAPTPTFATMDIDQQQATPTQNSHTNGTAPHSSNGHLQVNGRDVIMEADESHVGNHSDFSAIRLDSRSPGNTEDMATFRARRPSSMNARASLSGDAGHGNSTNLLTDYTDNIRYLSGSIDRTPSRRPVSMLPSTTATHQMETMSMNMQASATPARQNIDFGIPPMPTPRSVPTITPRELESLKSQFMSEISSLKASLLGKEAEVQSLKAAVADAEKRVGGSMEKMREEQQLREQFEVDKDTWERRGREMEAVLRKVRDEIVIVQAERDEFESKLTESEGRREMAEMMAQDAESKMAGMRAGQQQLQAAAAQAANPGAPKSAASRSPAAATAREVEVAVERVARELHSLYKSKHETKVAALKKSYESRWEKKVQDLEQKIADLEQENDRLRQQLAEGGSRIDPRQAQLEEERRIESVNNAATLRQLQAEFENVEAVLREITRDNGDLRQALEQERVEKGELVQLAEEMMAMQAVIPPPAPEPREQYHQEERYQQTARTPAKVNPNRSPARTSIGPVMPRPPSAASASSTGSNGSSNLRTPGKPKPMSMIAGTGISRPSGLRAPGGASRPPVAHERHRSSVIRPRPGAARTSQIGSLDRMSQRR